MQFWEGYLLGLGMILFIGPVFFLLLSISLQMGTKPGVFVALGIIVSDIICVCLCYFGITSFLYESKSKFWISLLGGILLILLGFKYILKPSNPPQLEQGLPSLHYATCFTKGFLVNFVNPFVFFVWIGVTSYAKKSQTFESDSLFYLLGVLFAILSTDLLKVFTAKQIKAFLNPNALKFLFRFSGILFIGFGMRMIFLAL